MIYLILGGARSGKSSHAQMIATQKEQAGQTVIYIATACADKNDDEMSGRIRHHKNHRPSHWQTLEIPKQLADTLHVLKSQQNIVIMIDCLTLWLTNVLISNELAAQKQALLSVLDNYPHDVIMVSNETGLGVVPMGRLSRQFVDESGFLHQQLAKLADKVVLCVAGLPMILKSDVI